MGVTFISVAAEHPLALHAAQRDAAVHGLVADAPADTAPGSATPTTDPLRR